jgi:hypothetical protein
MSSEERDQGRKWIEGEIAKTANEREVRLSKPITWHKDFDHMVYWVEAEFDGNIKRWKFSYEQLEDCVNDKTVRRELEKAIGFFVPSEGSQTKEAISLQQSVPQAEGSPPTKHTRTLRVFLCHSGLDKPTVRTLYRELKAEGIDPWFDEEELVPGEDWELTIRRAVRETDVVLVCISNVSVTRRGFAQKEIKLALDVADEQPEGTIFIIPVRLDDCAVPDRLRRWQWLNLFEPNGLGKLMTALERRATELGIKLGREEIRVGERVLFTKEGVEILKPLNVIKEVQEVQSPFVEIAPTFCKAAYFDSGEVLSPPGYDLAYRSQTLCYLRLIPTVALETPIELAALKDVVLGAPLLRDSSYASVLPGINRHGAITCTFTESTLSASTQLFQNGEIWCVSATLIRTERDRVPGYFRVPCLSAFVLEQTYYDTLRRLAEFATTKIGLKPPWTFELGLTGVNGLYFNWEDNPFSPQVGPVYKTEIVHRSLLRDIEPGFLDELVLTLSSKVFDSVGERRPADLYGFPPNRPGLAGR